MEFYPKIKRAEIFVAQIDSSIEHAMVSDEAKAEIRRQFAILGWSDEVQQTILTALDVYKNQVQAKLEPPTAAGSSMAEKKVLRYVVFDEKPEIMGSGSDITFEQYFKDENAAMEALKHHERLLRYVSEDGRTYREYYNKDTGEWT